MSVIEDTRKIAQDFLTPELRAISGRLDALEQRYGLLDRKIDDVDRRAEKRHEAVIQTVEKRHDQVMSAIAGLSDLMSIKERVARLESNETRHQ
jgi:hypothetical protein